MTWQQFLIEKVLGERWHEWIKRPEVGLQAKCSCGMLYDVTSYNRADILYIHRNRTFTNRNDMMDLYERIEKEDNTELFLRYCYRQSGGMLNIGDDGDVILYSTSIAWLFCLDGKGYEDRCKMVAEFYGWEEKA